ncbi:MAG: L-2-hydroxyglutarate oxidase [Thermoplasmatota archaeon]
MVQDGPRSADVVVVGAGAIGGSVARALAKAGKRVLVVEKEPGPSLHQSGRNSGVIHAGYNLKPGSAKAKFCVEGSRRLRAFCAERNIAVRQGGILIVARTEAERATLAELQRRAKGNGVEARLVDAPTIREIEPAASGIEALHAPEGASFDARAYVHALTSDALVAGAEILYDTKVIGIEDPALPLGAAGSDGAPAPTKRGDDGVTVVTSKGRLTARVVVNCAGLHADRIAQSLARDMRIIPFRGYYAELVPAKRDLVRSHVYASPDLAFPFLGVHLSRRADGRVIVGPGAMLAFGREAYRFSGVNVRDMASTLSWPGFWRMLAQPKMPHLIRTEVAKSLSLGAIAREARLLVPGLERADLARSFAGNRAQMVGRDGKLVDDIIVRETPNAVHVLNAVSPGLTCSLPFGESLAEKTLAKF